LTEGKKKLPFKGRRSLLSEKKGRGKDFLSREEEERKHPTSLFSRRGRKRERCARKKRLSAAAKKGKTVPL